MDKHLHISWQRRQSGAKAVPRDHGGSDLTVILLTTLALSACGPSALAPATPLTQHGTAPPSVSPVHDQSLRVIVKFRQTVPYRDDAFLQSIALQIQARVAYLGSVSPDTHVYRIEPQPGQSQADILQRLSEIPSVLRVETDTVARPS
ncbi:MAG: hypothetical protein ACYCZL_01855 [Polaromonas sp.]